ncbi:hypothetical protein D9M71_313420 [compost metagenome]
MLHLFRAVRDTGQAYGQCLELIMIDKFQQAAEQHHVIVDSCFGPVAVPALVDTWLVEFSETRLDHLPEDVPVRVQQGALFLQEEHCGVEVQAMFPAQLQ